MSVYVGIDVRRKRSHVAVVTEYYSPCFTISSGSASLCGQLRAWEVTVSDRVRLRRSYSRVTRGGRDALPALWKRTTTTRPRGSA